MPKSKTTALSFGHSCTKLPFPSATEKAYTSSTQIFNLLWCQKVLVRLVWQCKLKYTLESFVTN